MTAASSASRPGAAGDVGVLAVQGDFEAHCRALTELGAVALEVRTPEALDGLDGLVIPGGESTTISKGMERDGFDAAIRERFADGMPVFGSCAGMIVCDRDHLGLGDYRCRRNAFGRQLASFEEDLVVEGLGDDPLRAVYIRAPWAEDVGAGVDVLASHEGHPVALRDGNLLAVAFHAELTDDRRLHALFMAIATNQGDHSDGASTPHPRTRSGGGAGG